MTGTKTTFKEYIKERLEAMSGFQKRKKAILDKMNEINEKINKLEDTRNTLKKTLPRDLINPQEIQAAIQNLQKKYETTSMDS